MSPKPNIALAGGVNTKPVVRAMAPAIASVRWCLSINESSTKKVQSLRRLSQQDLRQKSRGKPISKSQVRFVCSGSAPVGNSSTRVPILGSAADDYRDSS